MRILKKMVITIALTFPAMALAQSTQELKAELEALKLHVKKLEAMIEKVTAQTAAPVQAPQAGGETVDLAQFNQLKTQSEGLDTALEAAGLKNLKISGYIDPTYIFNKNRKTSSFVFLNNNSSVNGSEEVFSFDNSLFGRAFLSFEKEFEGGTQVKLALSPSKSTSASFNFGNIIEEASFSTPLTDKDTRLIGGQILDFIGYEETSPVENKLITHNLLYDFTAASFYTGLGVELTRGDFVFTTVLGNLNRARIDDARRRAPGIFYRGDYTINEFAYIGFAGINSGFNDNVQFGRLDIFEVDGGFARGNWTLNGQLTAGRQKPSDENGFRLGSTTFYGLSSLVAYKFTERFEGIARFDFISNKRNGGGLFGSTFGGFGGDCVDTTGADATCPDGLNGFGSGLVFDGNKFVVADPNSGSNRATLSLGLNYAFRPGVNLKAEYRYDRSTSNTFLDANNVYRRDNHVVGFSTVLSF